MTDQPQRLNLVVGRGRILAVDDSGPIQRLQVDLGPTGPDGASMQLIDDMPMMVLFGYRSNPPAQSDVVTLHIGGRRTAAIGVGHNSQALRKTGQNPGESGLYDQWGETIDLTQAGIRLRDQWGNTVQLAEDGITLTDRWGNTFAMGNGEMALTHATKISLNAPLVEVSDNMKVGGELDGV